MARLDARLADLCAQPARSGDERATCEKLLGSHAKPAAQA
jgi:hypothetical protein